MSNLTVDQTSNSNHSRGVGSAMVTVGLVGTLIAANTAIDLDETHSILYKGQSLDYTVFHR